MALDVAARLNHKSVAIVLDVYQQRSVRSLTLIVFMLKYLASERGLVFELNLNVKFFRGGDSFQWPWPPCSGRRGSPL